MSERRARRRQQVRGGGADNGAASKKATNPQDREANLAESHKAADGDTGTESGCGYGRRGGLLEQIRWMDQSGRGYLSSSRLQRSCREEEGKMSRCEAGVGKMCWLVMCMWMSTVSADRRLARRACRSDQARMTGCSHQEYSLKQSMNQSIKVGGFDDDVEIAIRSSSIKPPPKGVVL